MQIYKLEIQDDEKYSKTKHLLLFQLSTKTYNSFIIKGF